MNDYTKARNKVKVVIRKAVNERDTKGYRENLGYDKQPYIRNYISKLDLSYQQECDILDYFIRECDNI